VFDACDELGIGFVAFSPLGRGFLTGAMSKDTAFSDHDFRKSQPRFSAAALDKNQALVDLLKRVAANKHATPAQVALAWILAQRPWITPIPGTTKLSRFEENIAAAELQLSSADLADIHTALAEIDVEGARYSPEAVGTAGM
jgi:aryl-alcohol dehydrogenase-like predicted oxidoreductase